VYVHPHIQVGFPLYLSKTKHKTIKILKHIQHNQIRAI